MTSLKTRTDAGIRAPPRAAQPEAQSDGAAQPAAHRASAHPQGCLGAAGSGLVLAGVLGGAYTWHDREEQRKGEAARDQVMTALRITNHALNQVKTQLAEHDRDRQE